MAIMLQGPTLDFTEWQQMITKFKLAKKFTTDEEQVTMSALKEEDRQKIADREAHFERVVEAASALSTGLIETLVTVSTSLGNAADAGLHKSARTSLNATRDKLLLLMAVVRIKIAKEVVSDDTLAVQKIFTDTESEIKAMDLASGKIDSAVIAAASIAGYA
jgi:hypothetical protein